MGKKLGAGYGRGENDGELVDNEVEPAGNDGN